MPGLATELPVLLAGPILRRVTQTEVWVWIACSRPVSAQLVITAGTASVTGTAAQTVAIGGALHITVARAAITFPSGTVCSYDVKIDGAGGLAALGMLAAASASGLAGPALPLGYTVGALPTFVVPPPLAQFRLCHASCRNTNNGSADDALADLDIQIQSPTKRPHLLVLTGDQIYADDVNLALSVPLTSLGHRLIWGDSTATSVIPLRGWANPASTDEKLVPVTQATFPAGARQPFSERVFTSTEASCHLMSVDDFAAMYLLSWSAIAWSLVDVPAYAAFRASFSPDLGLYGGAPPAVPDESTYTAAVASLTSWAKGIPAIARVLANVPTAMIFDDHEITDDWNRTQRWRRRAFTGDHGGLGRAIVRNGMLAYCAFQDLGNDAASYLDTPIPPAPGGKHDVLATAMAYTTAFADAAYASAAKTLDGAFGIAEVGDPTLTFATRFAPHPEVAVALLDVRTRRRYRTEDHDPQLMSATEIARQLPLSAAPAPLVTFVVSPANVISDGGFRWAQRLGVLAAIFGDVDGADSADIEGWDADAIAVSALMRQLAQLRSAVVLSGDVHHGFTTNFSIFTPTQRKQLAQLVASATHNWDRSWRSAVQGGGNVASNRVQKFYESRPPVWGMYWDVSSLSSSDTAQIASAAAYAGAHIELSYAHDDPPNILAAIGPGTADLFNHFPAGLRRPDGYWSTNLIGGAAAQTSSSAPAKTLRQGVSPLLMWRNHYGVVTTTAGPTLSALRHELRSGAISLVHDVMVSTPVDKLFGWTG